MNLWYTASMMMMPLSGCHAWFTAPGLIGSLPVKQRENRAGGNRTVTQQVPHCQTLVTYFAALAALGAVCCWPPPPLLLLVQKCPA